MKMYFVSLIVTWVLSIFVTNSKKEKNKIFALVLLMFSLTMISGLRIDTAVYSDEYNYRTMFYGFNEISDITWDFFSEPLFGVFNLVINNIFGNDQYFIFITSAIINVSFIYFIYKHSKNFTLSMFAYICLGTFFTGMNIIRQYLAIVVIMWGFDYMINNKFIKFLLYVFVATMIHKSSIVVIVYYFLVNSKVMMKYKFISIILLIVFLISFDSFMQIVSYTPYKEYYLSYADSYGVGIIRVLFFSIMYGFIIVNSKALYLYTNKKMINIILLSLSIAVTSLRYVFVERLNYFPYVFITMLPLICVSFTPKSRSIVNMTLYVALFLFGFILTKDLAYNHILLWFI